MDKAVHSNIPIPAPSKDSPDSFTIWCPVFNNPSNLTGTCPTLPWYAHDSFPDGVSSPYTKRTTASAPIVPRSPDKKDSLGFLRCFLCISNRLPDRMTVTIWEGYGQLPSKTFAAFPGRSRNVLLSWLGTVIMGPHVSPSHLVPGYPTAQPSSSEGILPNTIHAYYRSSASSCSDSPHKIATVSACHSLPLWSFSEPEEISFFQKK